MGVEEVKGWWREGRRQGTRWVPTNLEVTFFCVSVSVPLHKALRRRGTLACRACRRRREGLGVEGRWASLYMEGKEYVRYGVYPSILYYFPV